MPTLLPFCLLTLISYHSFQHFSRKAAIFALIMALEPHFSYKNNPVEPDFDTLFPFFSRNNSILILSEKHGDF